MAQQLIQSAQCSVIRIDKRVTISAELREDMKIVSELSRYCRLYYTNNCCPYCNGTKISGPITEWEDDEICDNACIERDECGCFTQRCNECNQKILFTNFDKNTVKERNLKVKIWNSGDSKIIKKLPDTLSSNNIIEIEKKYYFNYDSIVSSFHINLSQQMEFYWKYDYQNDKKIIKFYPNLWRKMDFILYIGRYRFYEKYKHHISYIIKKGVVDEWQYFFYLFYQMPMDIQNTIINYFRLPVLIPCGNVFIDPINLHATFDNSETCSCKPPYHEIWCNYDKITRKRNDIYCMERMKETDKETKLYYNGKYYESAILNTHYVKFLDKYTT